MDQGLVKAGVMAAREIEAIKRMQAETVFPGSKLAKAVRVVPRISENGIGFTTTSTPYGKYQDKGTYGRRRKTGTFNPSPPRRRGSRNWSPSGIAPSFWNTIPLGAMNKIKGDILNAMKVFAVSQLPKKFTIKVR